MNDMLRLSLSKCCNGLINAVNRWTKISDGFWKCSNGLPGLEIATDTVANGDQISLWYRFKLKE